ncbi:MULTISPECIES: hypothetical protein [Bacillus]|uniref:Uncharacterized protein n=1 Tax=Bacillus glycinifermentans TaxID=1664069 RepID=A0A0T6BI32_9BACI|nr:MULTISPECIES: hypothetical protein [Bacillus]KRT87115.1 hypothetical protein AB447_209105 [Bacillus glycinifermentans]MEC0341997.1 hypothetical protein [Bacillus sonorensis]MEC0457489.1 hypothetical protein [Bacillus sonorensis]MEC0487166.1 hypothetical protein [Bacillus glycinifermentans]MEC0530716.1 hypothetical protein [Bacillus sonorensis]
MFVVKTLYDLENCGIGSDVELFEGLTSANNHASKEKEEHLKEWYKPKDEVEVIEDSQNGLYSCVIQEDNNFWSVTVEEKIFHK